MAVKKLILFAVTTSLGLTAFLAPSCFADQEYEDTLSTLSGSYGYYINGNYGRGVNFNNTTLPVELITGSGSNAKYLFGVGVTIPVNVRQQAYSYLVRGSFTLNQASNNYNGANNVFNDASPIEATVTYADQSTEVIRSCGFDDITLYSTEVYCEVDTTKVVRRFFITIGYTNSFTYGTEPSLAYYSQAFNNGSIKITSAFSFVHEFSSESSATSGAINNLGDTMQDIHDEELDTINDSVGDASDSASDMDTSGFSLTNPLAPWLGLFSNNNCVSIPKLKSWLHGTESQVCSPWSSDVRSNLTPIVSILSVTVAFGLLINWLKSDGQT